MTDALLRPNLAHPDDDPRLWLEEVEGEDALAWVRARSDETIGAYATPRMRADTGLVAAMLDREDKLPYVRRRGPFLYNFWTDAGHPRGIWRRMPEADYRAERDTWEVLLDLDALAAEEGREWVWQGAGVYAEGWTRAMVRLSDGGSDAAELREFDLEAKAFLEDGFRLPVAKSGVSWLDQDTLMVASALSGVTESGYPRKVQRWARGTELADAPVIAETATDAMGMWVEVERSGDAPRVVLIEKPAFFETVVSIGTAEGDAVRLDIPPDARCEFEGDWLMVWPRTDWETGGRLYPADAVLVIRLSAFLAGARAFDVLFEPKSRRAAQWAFWSKDRLVLGWLDALEPVIEVFSFDGAWTGSGVLDVPKVGTASAMGLDVDPEASDGSLVIFSETPLVPPQMRVAQGGAAPEVWRRAPVQFDAAGNVARRFEAVSVDGERIPYVVVGPEAFSGDAPVHMSGYGGFGVSVEPYYAAVRGRLWLARGGVTVMANIRGGGEFGTPWHDAGKLEGKVLSHDDFAAVAADLVARGITRAERIAAEGGSNGGLLMANMLVRYPERFGALFCSIPLIDMRRYVKLPAGASWVAEYGDPEADWAFVSRFSAYHNVAAGAAYPPILIATTRRDDRVHPGHARKMALKLQDLGYDARFYEPAAGGHGYGTTSVERAEMQALGHHFLARGIGWEAGLTD